MCYFANNKFKLRTKSTERTYYSFINFRLFCSNLTRLFIMVLNESGMGCDYLLKGHSSAFPRVFSFSFFCRSASESSVCCDSVYTWMRYRELILSPLNFLVNILKADVQSSYTFFKYICSILYILLPSKVFFLSCSPSLVIYTRLQHYTARWVEMCFLYQQLRIQCRLFCSQLVN